MYSPIENKTEAKHVKLLLALLNLFPLTSRPPTTKGLDPLHPMTSYQPYCY